MVTFIPLTGYDIAAASGAGISASTAASTVSTIKAGRRAFGDGVEESRLGIANGSDREHESSGQNELFHALTVLESEADFYDLHKMF
jgi:hypothetical protein